MPPAAHLSSLPPIMPGLYIHIPFCKSRCIYCGFYSTTGLNLQSAYIQALRNELRLQTTHNPTFADNHWDTIYIGGGTPSTLPTHLLDTLIDSVYDTQSPPREFTIECNPDDITPEFASWLGSSPISRVSMGVQTFDDARLQWLRRRHNSQQVSRAVQLLRQHGISNISIDLIFGFPNQTRSEWNDDLSQALALMPQHLSAYSLMYDEGTPLHRLYEQGAVQEIDDELSLMMYNDLIDRLTAAGYEHYEISNFSRPGFRSQHNSSYWQQTPYLGIGAAAHSYDGTRRYWNIADVMEYITSVSQGVIPSEQEVIDEVTRYNDIVTTALRTCEGINLADLTPQQYSYITTQASKHLVARNLQLTNNHLHLTRQGIFISDDIMSDLILLDDE